MGGADLKFDSLATCGLQLITFWVDRRGNVVCVCNLMVQIDCMFFDVSVLAPFATIIIIW